MLHKKENSLLGLIDGLLGPENGILKIVDFTQLLKLSQIVTQLPQGVTSEEYYLKIGSEVTSLLFASSIQKKGTGFF